MTDITDTNSREFDVEATRILKEKGAFGEAGSEFLADNVKKSLGKANSTMVDHSSPSLIDEIGWIRVKPETLPSQGIFYPVGTEFTIRAAAAAEIRHWSTLDEDDILSLDDALNKLVDKCCRVRFPNGTRGSFKDIKEIDRFFIVFAIREYTFKKGENELKVTFKCPSDSKNDTVSIKKEMLNYYVPDEELQARFSEEERCFHLKLINGEEVRLYLPTLGIMNYIKNYLKEKSRMKEDYDEAFIKWAPFIFPDWRILNNDLFNKTLQDSHSWSLDKISIVDWFVDKMQKTVHAELKHNCSVCGSEVTAPISFPGGVKSLFLISDIASKLL